VSSASRRVRRERTIPKRLPQRATDDRATIHAILDEARICHLAFVHDDGYPVVTPTLHARVGDVLYVHGSAASRTLRALAAGVDVCVAVTLFDGIVLARAAFHHSVNYRSVVLYGRAEAIEAPEEKLRALEAFTEQLVPGRWADVRKPNEKELRITSVLRLPLDEVTAKVRTGPPLDDEPDYGLDVWAGVVPFALQAQAAQPDAHLAAAIEPPGYIASL
jgi:uncharacterized protein